MGTIYSAFSPSFALAAAGRHILRILAVSEESFKLNRFWINTDNVAASIEDLVLNRVTDAGTETGNLTVTPMSQNSGAFTGDHGYNLTVAPTVSVEVLRFLWDSQVPFEWVFAPGEELIIPGATNEGFSIELETDPTADIIVGAIIETL